MPQTGMVCTSAQGVVFMVSQSLFAKTRKYETYVLKIAGYSFSCLAFLFIASLNSQIIT